MVRHLGTLPAAPPLDGLYANYPYDPILRPPMHAFKYQKQAWLARFFMRDIHLPDAVSCDAIVPVPMHPIKAYLRTYNPPEALALALQEHRPDLPIRTDLLKKVKLTRSQTTLDAAARKRNVQQVFLASNDVRGMKILLIDDVVTTGSTLHACAKALKSQGAAAVYALCACQATAGNESLPYENEAMD